MIDLLAIAACKFVLTGNRAITGAMTNFITIDAFYLDLLGISGSFFGTAASGMTKL